MNALEKMIPSPAHIQAPSISFGEFRHSDIAFNKSFPQKDQLEKLLAHKRPLALRDGWKLFDAWPEFITDVESQKLRYLYMGIGRQDSKGAYARVPQRHLRDESDMKIDTRFFVYFYADFLDPRGMDGDQLAQTWWGDFQSEEEFRAVPQILALCGFDYRLVEGGITFFHIKQFQAGRWSKKDAHTLDADELARYHQDLPVKWTHLATHVVEQLAQFDRAQGHPTVGVFMSPNRSFMYEERGEDHKTVKGDRVARQRKYHPYMVDHEGETLVSWKPVSEIQPDTQFQKTLLTQTPPSSAQP